MTRRSTRTSSKTAPPGAEVRINEDELTAQLAERVMGWRAVPDRFIKPRRSWLPRWRFQPFEEIEDAFQLLDHAVDRFRLTSDSHKIFTAEVHIGGRSRKASGVHRAKTISTAIALALGIEGSQRLVSGS
jgi:hypothetical protein